MRNTPTIQTTAFLLAIALFISSCGKKTYSPSKDMNKDHTNHLQSEANNQQVINHKNEKSIKNNDSELPTNKNMAKDHTVMKNQSDLNQHERFEVKENRGQKSGTNFLTKKKKKINAFTDRVLNKFNKKQKGNTTEVTTKNNAGLPNGQEKKMNIPLVKEAFVPMSFEVSDINSNIPVLDNAQQVPGTHVQTIANKLQQLTSQCKQFCKTKLQDSNKSTTTKSSEPIKSKNLDHVGVPNNDIVTGDPLAQGDAATVVNLNNKTQDSISSVAVLDNAQQAPGAHVQKIANKLQQLTSQCKQFCKTKLQDSNKSTTTKFSEPIKSKNLDHVGVPNNDIVTGDPLAQRDAATVVNLNNKTQDSISSLAALDNAQQVPGAHVQTNVEKSKRLINLTKGRFEQFYQNKLKKLGKSSKINSCEETTYANNQQIIDVIPVVPIISSEAANVISDTVNQPSVLDQEAETTSNHLVDISKQTDKIKNNKSSVDTEAKINDLEQLIEAMYTDSIMHSTETNLPFVFENVSIQMYETNFPIPSAPPVSPDMKVTDLFNITEKNLPSTERQENNHWEKINLHDDRLPSHLGYSQIDLNANDDHGVDLKSDNLLELEEKIGQKNVENADGIIQEKVKKISKSAEEKNFLEMHKEYDPKSEIVKLSNLSEIEAVNETLPKLRISRLTLTDLDLENQKKQGISGVRKKPGNLKRMRKSVQNLPKMVSYLFTTRQEKPIL